MRAGTGHARGPRAEHEGRALHAGERDGRAARGRAGGGAERQLREGYEALAEGGGSHLLPSSAALLAEALLAQERDEEAEHFVAVAQATASPDDLDAQIRWRNVSARLGARAGRAEEAERTARAAVELAARTDSVELQGDAALALAEALRAAMRPEAAAEAFREAQALYEVGHRGRRGARPPPRSPD